MNEKQQQLTFEKGITTIPSDALCSDNALADEINLYYDNGEHKPLLPFALHETGITGTLLYVHRLPDGKKCKIYKSTGNSPILLYDHDNSHGTIGPSPGISVSAGITKNQVQAIGKTLVVTTDSGLKYCVWNGSGYTVYDKIPEPDVKFYMLKDVSKNYKECKYEGSFFDDHTGPSGYTWIAEDHKDEFRNALAAAYAENKKSIRKDKGFCEPFFVVVALKLFDGSYTKIGNPMLMVPSVTVNTEFSQIRVDTNSDGMDWFVMRTYFAKMYVKNSSNYAVLSDIVKSVDVFITDGVRLYDTDNDPVFEQSTGVIGQDGIYATTVNGKSDYHATRILSSELLETNFLRKREADDIDKDITSASVFYKVAELPIEDGGTSRDLGEYVYEHTLENLVTQEQMRYNDYYSHCPLSADFLYAYNARLNIAAITRGFFDGFEYFMPYDDSSSSAVYDIYVRIKTDTGYRVVKKTTQSTSQRMGFWFYYPDPRAVHVTIKSGNTTYLNADLKEHTGLHGAYYFFGIKNIPTSDVNPPTSGTEYTTVNTSPEYLQNQMATSEVNNPFVFLAEGYNTVGSAKILGMSSQTQALSQGQFGQHPLIVFTEEGMWAMQVGSTGIFTSARPMAREVCNNVDSITQTDNAIFFTSKKGLMMANGSQVVCVSEQMNGKFESLYMLWPAYDPQHPYPDQYDKIRQYDQDIPFSEYLAGVTVGNVFYGTMLAYDYQYSVIWIFNPAKTYCYAYALKTGTFSRHVQGYPPVSIVNDYPAMLLQLHNPAAPSYDQLYTTDRDFDINHPPQSGSANVRTWGAILTRPMKLENALALKSIMQMRHIHNLDEDTVLRVAIFASNNLYSPSNWTPIKSLGGTPWKYYRLRFIFTNMEYFDSFAGTMLITQERRNNKLR